jgi:hypothetical protein
MAGHSDIPNVYYLCFGRHPVGRNQMNSENCGSTISVLKEGDCMSLLQEPLALC